ncbi:FecR family protein [Parapedobacter tibetensis]|uniref:FecR family protein n=1 Tax=Parapedobacter tibetensis TaxID=2972951 RepID=UPI00214DE6F7|nr:FecR family protein [Parapedobacter tibetensis]
MEFDKARLRQLLQGYMSNQISADELLELKQYMLQTDTEGDLNAVIDSLWHDLNSDTPMSAQSDSMYRSILNDPRVQANPPIKQPKSSRLIQPAIWRWTAGVAALLCIGMLFFLHDRSTNDNTKDEQLDKTVLSDAIVPGGEKAILTLSNGRTINLDEISSGRIAEESGMRIVKTAEGQLFYESIHTTQVKEVVYNTISTPNGGEQRMILPDGTKVWLNAASTLTYPTQFIGNKRIVELEGEAYFEVSSQSSAQSAFHLPFLVKTKTQTVEVLGTHFNINAYNDGETVKTTLLEGRVKVSATTSRPNESIHRILNPNEEATVKRGSNIIQVAQVDPTNAIAWKNGYFAFSDEHITYVMTTIARWYDIEVEYQGDMTNKYFGGTISRFEDFETLLGTIALTGSIRFRIVGRRVIVMT